MGLPSIDQYDSTVYHFFEIKIVFEMARMYGYSGWYSYQFRSVQYGPVDVTILQRGNRPFPIDVITELS